MSSSNLDADDEPGLNNGHAASSTPSGAARDREDAPWAPGPSASGAEDNEEEVFEFDDGDESPIEQAQLNSQVMHQLEDMFNGV